MTDTQTENQNIQMTIEPRNNNENQNIQMTIQPTWLITEIEKNFDFRR